MYLVTGVAGFIGFHVARRLLNAGQEVFGLDSINSSYDPAIKYARLHQLQGKSGFRFQEGRITDPRQIAALMRDCQPTTIIHLAAQAGVGESMAEPTPASRTTWSGS